MNSARYNTYCNGKVRWDGDGDGAGVGNDDLDDARDDGDRDDDYLPLREGFSPTESAHRRGLFFSGGFCLAAVVELLILAAPLGF